MRQGRARAQALSGVDVLGWVSSLLLVITLGWQVRKQWLSRNSGGVSLWLFIGQLAASSGFSVYSYLLGNWVFLATNLLMVINALLGQWVTMRNRGSPPSSPAS
jgi:MtN3 and saliva related transmembrane protein